MDWVVFGIFVGDILFCSVCFERGRGRERDRNDE